MVPSCQSRMKNFTRKLICKYVLKQIRITILQRALFIKIYILKENVQKGEN